MKKIISVFVVVCLLAIGIFAFTNYSNNNSLSKNTESEFLVASNANGVFDPTFLSSSNMQFSVPAYSPALPFEEKEKLEELNSVAAIYPYYPLFIFEKANGMQSEFIYWQSDENQKQTQKMPLMYENSAGQEYPMNELRFKLVTNQNKFNTIHEDSTICSFLKKYDCSSGIYISDTLYEKLNLDDNATQLTIQVPVQVPIVAEMINTIKEEGTPYAFEANEYTVVKYASVDVTLEVAGVINTKSGVNFCQGLGIVIPYDLAKEIYENVDQSSIQLEENQMLWEPNTYIIQCKENVTMDDLGNEILSEIGQAYLRQYEYDDAIYNETKLYNQDEVLSWLK